MDQQPARTILHVDMDAFFAAIEQRDRPELRGVPLLIGFDGPRGVVATASYEARPFGCRSAQPMSVALRLCPHAVAILPDHARYAAVSTEVRAILDAYTPLVEPLSIDEAFLDVTGSRRLHGDGVTIAKSIRARIHGELGLTASVGVAPNKFLAKLASDLNKPDGLTIVDAENVLAFLDPLPIGRMWGVGPRAEAKLTAMGVRTFADLRAIDAARLTRRLGAWGEQLHRLARGLDDRAVTTGGGVKSVSHEHTFGRDQPDRERVRATILEQSEQVGRRLRAKGIRGRTVTIKIRYGDFETITRSMTLPGPTDVTRIVWSAASDLFDAWAATSFRPIRLVGVAVSQLEDGRGQLDLFEPEEGGRDRRLDEAADRIRQAFGTGALARGSTLARDPSPPAG